MTKPKGKASSPKSKPSARPKAKAKPKPKAQPAAGQANHGGARPGAGRKVREIAVALRALKVEKLADAEYAYGLYVAAMRTEDLGITTRLECAAQVMDRVWGKPTLHVENTKVRKMVMLDPDPPRDRPLPAVPIPALGNGHSNGYLPLAVESNGHSANGHT